MDHDHDLIRHKSTPEMAVPVPAPFISSDAHAEEQNSWQPPSGARDPAAMADLFGHYAEEEPAPASFAASFKPFIDDNGGGVCKEGKASKDWLWSICPRLNPILPPLYGPDNPNDKDMTKDDRAGHGNYQPDPADASARAPGAPENPFTPEEQARIKEKRRLEEEARQRERQKRYDEQQRQNEELRKAIPPKPSEQKGDPPMPKSTMG